MKVSAKPTSGTQTTLWASTDRCLVCGMSGRYPAASVQRMMAWASSTESMSCSMKQPGMPGASTRRTRAAAAGDGSSRHCGSGLKRAAEDAPDDLSCGAPLASAIAADEDTPAAAAAATSAAIARVGCLAHRRSRSASSSPFVQMTRSYLLGGLRAAAASVLSTRNPLDSRNGRRNSLPSSGTIGGAVPLRAASA